MAERARTGTEDTKPPGHVDDSGMVNAVDDFDAPAVGTSVPVLNEAAGTAGVADDDDDDKTDDEDGDGDDDSAFGKS